MVTLSLEDVSFDIEVDVNQFRLPLVTYETHSTENAILQIIQAFAPEPETLDDPLGDYDLYSKPNWDGFDAEPITPVTVLYARKLLGLMPGTLGAPHIAPGADGSIGFYWSADQGPFRSLCVDIGPGEKWRAYWYLRDSTFDKVTSRQIDHTTAATLDFLFESLSA